MTRNKWQWLLEEKRMVRNRLISVSKWCLNTISINEVLICLINGSLAIQLIENPSESGSVYFFSFFKKIFRMRSFITMICVNRNWLMWSSSVVFSRHSLVIKIYRKEKVDLFIYPPTSEIKFNKRWWVNIHQINY